MPSPCFWFTCVTALVAACLFANVATSEAAPPAVANGYRTPAQNVVDILDAKPTPRAILSPDRRTMLLVEYQPYPPVALLARPILKLGGARIDPALHADQRTTQYTGLSLLDVTTGRATPIPLPKGILIGSPSWSLDGKRFAFTQDTETDGVRLWVGDLSGKTRKIENVRLADILLSPMKWRDDSKTLLVARVPQNLPAPPQRPATPAGPVVSATEGKVSRMATFQDLLKDTHDEAQFEYYMRSELAYVNADSGTITPILPADLWAGTSTSPDEKYILVTRLHRPYSYRVPLGYFARSTEVRDAVTGTLVYTVAELPVSDEIPQQGVPTGPRALSWQEKMPATLIWAEALDGGDPLKKVPHRDKLMTLAAPFTATPRELLKVVHRYSGLDWFDRANDVLLSEYDRDRRWSTTYRLDLTNPEATKKIVFDLSVNDAYGDPGDPIHVVQPNGDVTILQTGETIYLSGRGATPDGDRPFLDAYDLVTGKTTRRIFQNTGDGYESFLAFVGNDLNIMLTSQQSKTQPANYFRTTLSDNTRTALTTFPDPHPQITGLSKERLVYKRKMDGVPLSGTLVLPPGYDKARDGALPLLVWAYPEEYSDASTAGQVRGSTQTFTRLGGTSPLWFVTQGYAVLLDATMPVVGDPETMNDTFVEQIVGAAQAAIDACVEKGVADPRRVLVSGHSYGAFMTANLLAHSDIFAAGIARSGAYNRTLTPFGFQSERRSFWEAREIYMNLSPFTHAEKIKKPLLLIHGQEDNNPGTHTLQSERFYQALAANGATAKLVLLPHESHGYAARESILHVLAEMFEWADKYVKNRPDGK